MKNDFNNELKEIMKRRDRVLLVAGIALVTFIMVNSMNDDFKRLHEVHIPQKRVAEYTDSTYGYQTDMIVKRNMLDVDAREMEEERANNR